jgi:hypothetical protein
MALHQWCCLHAAANCHLAVIRCRAYDPARLSVRVSGCLLLVPCLVQLLVEGESVVWADGISGEHCACR